MRRHLVELLVPGESCRPGLPRQERTATFHYAVGRIFFSKHSSRDEPLLARIPAKISQGREHGRRTTAATAGSAGHSETLDGVAQGLEGQAGLSNSESTGSLWRGGLPQTDLPRSPGRMLRPDKPPRHKSPLATVKSSTHKKTPTLNQPSAFETLKGFASRIRTQAVPRRCTSSR